MCIDVCFVKKYTVAWFIYDFKANGVYHTIDLTALFMVPSFPRYLKTILFFYYYFFAIFKAPVYCQMNLVLRYFVESGWY